MSKQTVYQPPKDVEHKVGPIHQFWPSKYVCNYKAEFKYLNNRITNNKSYILLSQLFRKIYTVKP